MSLPPTRSLPEALQQIVQAVPAELAISAMRLDDGTHYGLQENLRQASASIIKLPILLELYRQAQEGLVGLEELIPLQESDKVLGAGVLYEMHAGTQLSLEDLARLMIVVSDNTASNLLIRKVSFEAVNSLMQNLGMKQTHLGRFFMHPPLPPSGDNFASAADFTLCLEQLWKRQILNEEFTQRALAILQRQQYREKIPLMLPEQVQCMHKTGELAGVRHDCGIVHDPATGLAYAITLLSRHGRCDWEVDRGLAEISRYFYQLFTG